jgi:uncharacterized NAD(P)/FAD-binding protein YdhS
MLDWLIVGGGLHGVHIALSLLDRAGVSRDRLRILDPGVRLLERWDQCTRNVAMPFLRSALVHHIGLDPFDLHDFSQTAAGKPLARFTPPYDRPALDLFRGHCEHIIRTARLDELHIPHRAIGIAERDAGVRIETDAGSLEAKRVTLAIGLSEQPHWPVWAQELKASGGGVDHIFDPGFDRERLPEWTHAVVVGGGITAAQTAVALAKRRPGAVTLVAPHEPKIHQFDSDPGWLGPKNMREFEQTRSLVARRRMIREARHRGSMPSDVLQELNRVAKSGMLTIAIASVLSARADAAGGATLHCAPPVGDLAADRIILATGFNAGRPGGAWLDAAVSERDWQCAECGFPVVDRQLRWRPRIHVTGPLAELELGPAARNIAGARRAAERLLHVA